MCFSFGASRSDELVIWHCICLVTKQYVINLIDI